MGTRPRVDDLALTLYFATFGPGIEPGRGRDALRLLPLIDAYDSGLDRPLDAAERAALPLALARQPLWSLGIWVSLLDDDAAARAHASDLPAALRWAHRIIDSLDRWRTTFA